MKKVLILCHHYLDRSPGQRFRFEQYIDYIRANGFEVEVSYLIDRKKDKVLYSPGNYFKKFFILLQSLGHRFKDLRRVEDYDLVFIFRETIMIGTSWFERQIAKKDVKTVFDFDDAIWIDNVSAGNRALAWLKKPAKTGDIINIVDLVFAGNWYLENYARQFNDRVIIMPTTIDTDAYQKHNPKPADSKICIGWSGSKSTIMYFDYCLPALKRIKEKYGDRVEFRVVGDENYRNEELDIQGMPWQSHTEVEDIAYMDIGLQPLPKNKWTEGKCGLKGLQYMAFGTPIVSSPVGSAPVYIRHGDNAMMAESMDEWFDALSTLIENAELRERMGKAARQTVIEGYSVHAHKDRYLNAFNELLKPDGDPLSV